MQITEATEGSYRGIQPYIQRWAFAHRKIWDTFMPVQEPGTVDLNGRHAGKTIGCDFENISDAPRHVYMQIRCVFDLDRNCTGFRLSFCEYQIDIEVDRVHALLAAMDACTELLAAVVQARQKIEDASTGVRTIFGYDSGYNFAAVELPNKVISCEGLAPELPTAWFPNGHYFPITVHV